MPELLSLPTPPAPRWPGLLASVGGEAAARAATSGSRWEDGYEFQPIDCDLNTLDPLPADCDVAQTFVPGSMNVGAADTVAGTPVILTEAATCSTIGNAGDVVTQRALDRLARTTSHKAEREFWTGAGHRASSITGQYLTDGNGAVLSSGTARPLAYAFAELADAWGDCAQGQRAMVHVTVKTAVLLISAGVVRMEGGLLLDGMNNIVVAGTGYDGSGTSHTPDATGDTAWAWASPIPSIRLSEIVVTQSPERIDKTNNVDTAISYRWFAALYDPCCVVGVNVDLCNTCCT